MNENVVLMALTLIERGKGFDIEEKIDMKRRKKEAKNETMKRENMQEKLLNWKRDKR